MQVSDNSNLKIEHGVLIIESMPQKNAEGIARSQQKK